jgi:hypothetical protein
MDRIKNRLQQLSAESAKANEKRKGKFISLPIIERYNSRKSTHSGLDCSAFANNSNEMIMISCNFVS